MKKIFYLMAVAIVALSFSACTDDDSLSSNLVINSGDTEVAINRLGGSVEIPIKANGEWTATISGNEMDELPWSDVEQAKGNGNGAMTVNVDYFNPALQIHERKAQITVKNGDKTQTITLRQYVGLKDGESADNDATEYYPDLWHGKGIGKGLNPLTGDMSNNFVLNIKNVINLAKDSNDYATLFTQEARPGMTADVILQDTLENNLDSLGVHATINVKFAKFKLGLEVDYKNKGKQVEHKAIYTGSQDLEYLFASASSADIASFLEEDWDKSNKKWVSNPEMSKKVVSAGFRSAWANVMKNKGDSTGFKKAVNKMISQFGPVFVDGATLGGSIFTAIEYDSLCVADSFKVGGAVKASLALAAIQINGEVNAGYSKVGTDIWQNSHFYCAVSGGNQSSYSKMLEQMNSNTPDRTALRDAAQQWMTSIRSSNGSDDNTAVISLNYTGIWNLFPWDVADEVKAVIDEYYKGKSTCISIDDMGVKKKNQR